MKVSSSIRSQSIRHVYGRGGSSNSSSNSSSGSSSNSDDDEVSEASSIGNSSSSHSCHRSQSRRQLLDEEDLSSSIRSTRSTRSTRSRQSPSRPQPSKEIDDVVEESTSSLLLTNVRKSFRYVWAIICVVATIYNGLSTYKILRQKNQQVEFVVPTSNDTAPSLQLTSMAFLEGEEMPSLYNTSISPPLQWNDVPSATHSFVVMMQDTNTSIRHWIVYNIPYNVRRIIEGTEKNYLPQGSIVVPNDWGKTRYDGPATLPLSGRHDYIFYLYALNVSKLDHRTMPNHQVPNNANDLLKAIEHYTIAKATLTGTYMGSNGEGQPQSADEVPLVNNMPNADATNTVTTTTYV